MSATATIIAVNNGRKLREDIASAAHAHTTHPPSAGEPYAPNPVPQQAAQVAQPQQAETLSPIAMIVGGGFILMIVTFVVLGSIAIFKRRR